MIVVVKGGARVSKRGSTIVISAPITDGKETKWSSVTVPLLDLEVLIIVGSRVRISSGVLLMLSESGVPVLIHSRRGDSFLINPFDVRIADVRRRLYRIADSPQWRLSIGRALIHGKLQGMINVARYFAYKDRDRGVDTSAILDSLGEIEKGFLSEASTIASTDDLRLYEAKWSKKLWEILAEFIPRDYGFTGRDPKARDPVNSSISYTYAVIYTLSTHALVAAGLDPYVGVIHSERAGRTSLTYDFSEMFKPIAIHATVTALRTGRIEMDGKGYLKKNSLEAVTKELYKLLKRKHRTWRYTAKGEIYAKAWELRQNIEKGLEFKPFIYTIK